MVALSFLEKIQKLAVVFLRNKFEYRCQSIEVQIFRYFTMFQAQVSLFPGFRRRNCVQNGGEGEKKYGVFQSVILYIDFTSRCRRSRRRSRQRRMSNIADASVYVQLDQNFD